MILVSVFLLLGEKREEGRGREREEAPPKIGNST
jgi:hypothetical protein